jgi:hypothetical protein
VTWRAPPNMRLKLSALSEEPLRFLLFEMSQLKGGSLGGDRDTRHG